jgi:hypothetical protein
VRARVTEAVREEVDGPRLRQEVVVAGVCPNGGHGEGVVVALERFDLMCGVVWLYERAWWC